MYGSRGEVKGVVGDWVFNGCGGLTRIKAIGEENAEAVKITVGLNEDAILDVEDRVKVVVKNTVRIIPEYDSDAASDDDVSFSSKEVVEWEWKNAGSVVAGDWVAIPRYDSDWVWAKQLDITGIKMSKSGPIEKVCRVYWVAATDADGRPKMVRQFKQRIGNNGAYVVMNVDEVNRWVTMDDDLFQMLGYIWINGRIKRNTASKMWLKVDNPDIVGFIMDTSEAKFGSAPSVYWTSEYANIGETTNVIVWNNQAVIDVFEWMLGPINSEGEFTGIYDELWATRREYVVAFISGAIGDKKFVNADKPRLDTLWALARCYGVPLGKNGVMLDKVVSHGNPPENFVQVMGCEKQGKMDLKWVATSDGGVSKDGLVIGLKHKK